jgi:acetyl-CoA carboxylase carboxyltransferase component
MKLSDISDNIQEYRKRRSLIEAGGGAKGLEKQHKAGKMSARERVRYLVDEGTFVEVDGFATHRCANFGMDQKEIPADAVVTGIGRVNSKKIALFSQDFTVLGGSLGETHAKKIMKIQDMAMRMGIPIVGLNDSGGARIQEGVDALFGYGGIFYRNTLASGVVPQFSVIMGPCAGGAVYSPAITDFVIMVDQIAKMFITGPQVIKAVTGEEVTQEELGGAMVHNQKSGNAHFLAESDAHALDILRQILSYIPSNNLELPPNEPASIPVDLPEQINSMIPADPRKSYDIRDIIQTVLDPDSFLEVHAHYAQNIIVGFARAGGQSVGIVANQPKIWAGSLDINASDKAARFIRFLDAFNIPIVTFVDTPGFLPGTAQEYGGIIRHGAKLLYAYSEATVPKITFILRKAYGGAYIAMGSQHLGADFVFGLPTAEIAVMGPEGAANIIFNKEIESAKNPEETRNQRIQEYKEQFSNPYAAAARGYIESVIEPVEMRKFLHQSLEICLSKSQNAPQKKHGNIPL